MLIEQSGGADNGAGDGAPPAGDAPVETQAVFWDQWNASTREQHLDEISLRQRQVVTSWLTRMGRVDLDILEIGCGSGWLVPRLLPFGFVTATDFAPEVMARARARNPSATFVTGDFMALDFGVEQFDVAICLEVLAHVSDQKLFLSKIARHLRPGGLLMLATQNRPVLERYNNIAPPKLGNLRRWVDAEELSALLSGPFGVRELFSVTPKANRGLMRLVNSNKLNAPVRLLLGDRIERLKERMGLGWTLMALGERKR